MLKQSQSLLWFKRSLLLAAATVVLAACGGGGGDSSTPAPTPTPTPTPTPPVPLVAGSLRVHFHSAQNDAASWGVYSWEGPVTPSPAWITGRFLFDKSDSFGGYVDIPIDPAKTTGKFLVTDGAGNKNCADDQIITFASTLATAGQEIWILPSDCTQYTAKPTVTVSADLSKASAYWLARNTLSWPGAPATDTYKLYYAANGGITASGSGVTGADGSFNLTVDSAGLTAPLKAKFVIAQNGTALKLSDTDAANAGAKLQGQVVVAQFDSSAKLVTATSLQIAGVLDDLYASAAASTNLGVTFDGAGVPTFKVWAPTAQSVKLNVYANATATTATTIANLTFDSNSGVWSYTAPDASWTNVAYYTYSVKVLSRWAGNTVVTNEVTDPYSISLNAKASGVQQHSFIGNLASSTLKPAGWDTTTIPTLADAMDISLYELHVRDFSASDLTVPTAHRGKYLAFADTSANGMLHLKRLQQAGLTHVHLLPAFDFASVNESGCVTPTISAAAANSTTQQAVSRANDCFNWGYDPVHYNAPEGSYATDANDATVRVKEFRSMVKALHDNGLRVVMDVVFNHTSASKQNEFSVLDKIVPTYYYRLTEVGNVRTDSCCDDTAAENAMMAKLMIDSVKLWATQYQVDGFRFDIMGMHPLSVLNQLQTDVNAAAGREIYLYGEGWNFGAISTDKYFTQATQNNMFGTGIGTFNDRLRDVVRGGGCCDSGSSLVTAKGFVNGATDLYYNDGVRLGLSGTLKDFTFVDRTGATINTGTLSQNYGYTKNPRETINYIEAHDGLTLFDVNAYKLNSATSIADRVRAQNLGNAIVLLSQGVPFIHAGQDILRSKSFDPNSYDSGDWFNVLDFSYQSNNFGVGLPPGYDLNLMSPFLINASIKPGNASIISARDVFNDFLAIRKSSTLFRLRSGADIRARLGFHNTGPSQASGVVVAAIDGLSPTAYAGATYKGVVIVVNGSNSTQSVTVDALKNKGLTLHPVQVSGADTVVKSATYTNATGAFSVPALTVAVFVQP